MSVKDEVLYLLRDRDWVSCEDFELLFPPKTEGHLSWGQRLRQLRTEGYKIIKRRKYGHTFEYHLQTEKDTELESQLRHHNLLAERQPFETKGQFAFCKGG
jgi:hypothetical protein